MIRQSREEPLGKLELLIRPFKKCNLSFNNNADLENNYDNNLLNLNQNNQLEQSLETLRDDLKTGHLIEQYEVSEIFSTEFIQDKKKQRKNLRHFSDEKQVLRLKLVLVKIIIIVIVIKMFYLMIKHALY